MNNHLDSNTKKQTIEIEQNPNISNTKVYTNMDIDTTSIQSFADESKYPYLNNLFKTYHVRIKGVVNNKPKKIIMIGTNHSAPFSAQCAGQIKRVLTGKKVIDSVLLETHNQELPFLEWVKKHQHEHRPDYFAKYVYNKYGEKYYALLLAYNNNIPMTPCDRRSGEFAGKLENLSYNKEHQFVQVGLATLNLYTHKKSNETKEYILAQFQIKIETFKSVTDWPNFDYTLENWNKLFTQLYQLDYKSINSQTAKSLLDLTMINQESRMRDVFMYDKIRESLNENDTIVVVLGSMHIYTLHPALCKLLNCEYKPKK